MKNHTLQTYKTVKTVFLSILASLLIALTHSCTDTEPTASPADTQTPPYRPISLSYPLTYADSSMADTFFGKLIPDPYRWLEELSADDVRQWMQDQNKLTKQYLQEIPFGKEINQRLEELRKYETYSIPQLHGSHYYFFKQAHENKQAVLYRSPTPFGENATVVLNPNYFSRDGSIALGETAFSPNGRYLAFELKHIPSGWATIKIIDLQTGEELPDHLRYVKNSSIAWKENGFYYGTYTPPENGKGLPLEEFQEIRYHQVNSSQEEDPIIFMDPARPFLRLSPRTSQDGRYLFLHGKDENNKSSIYFAPTEDSLLLFQPLIENSEYTFKVVGSSGNSFYLYTNRQAPRFKLMRVYAAQPDSTYWETILQEDGEWLREVFIGQDRILAIYQHKAQNRLRQFDLDGRFAIEIETPPNTQIDQIGGTEGRAPFFFRQRELTRPARIFQLQDNSPIPRLLIAGQTPASNDAYTTKQVFIKSYDGASIPVFICYKKDLILDGNNPLLLYAAGTPGEELLPRYSAIHALLLERGALLAIVNARSEHKFGESKNIYPTQKAIDDLQVAAEYLSKQRYSGYAKIALAGKEEGALHAAAALIQRPDLFGTALLKDGFYDMLRLPVLTQDKTITQQYGTFRQEKNFDYLLSYSPLHYIDARSYPPVFVYCSFAQKRISPAHSLKFAARLQNAQQAKDHPVLLYCDMEKPDPQADADMLSFWLYQCLR